MKKSSRLDKKTEDILGQAIALTEAHALKDLVDEYVLTDPRFVGLAVYLASVRIFWSRAIKTACAGHGFIFFNPEFFHSIPEETRKTVVAHEIYHLILKHLDRAKKLDPDIANQAQDHAINIGLEDDGFTFEGTDPCKDRKYYGMSSEDIYNQIWEKKPEDRPSNPDGFEAPETIEDLIQEALDQDGKSKSLDDQIEDAEDAIDKAAEQAGNIPGSLAILLQATNRPVMLEGYSYQKIFEKYLIDPLTGGKRTFMRPNRRMHGQKSPLILAGRMKRRGHLNRLTHLVYALDVSGSINGRMRTQFHSSVATIKKVLNPEKLTVILFDTRIVHEQTFTDKQPYTDITVNAGGGTDLCDVYRRVAKLDPEALVVFTDLEVGIPPQPKWETIWLLPTKSCRIPQGLYGEVYLINDKV
jgi:predicted metal-dependent peptidase